jgi:acyl carrier protein
MSTTTNALVRELVLRHLSDGLARHGMTVDDVPDETDFFAEQMIDSFGLLELVMDIEEQFGISLDFESMDEDFTVIGPFCRYVEQLIAA